MYGRNGKHYVPDLQLRQSASAAHGERHALSARKSAKLAHPSNTRAELTKQGQEKHKEWEGLRPGGEGVESVGKSFAAYAKKVGRG